MTARVTVAAWPRRAKLALAIGVVLWLGGVALVPGELAAAKARAKIGARTAIALALFASAAVLTLHGLPRQTEPPPLPR